MRQKVDVGKMEIQRVKNNIYPQILYLLFNNHSFFLTFSAPQSSTGGEVGPLVDLSCSWMKEVDWRLCCSEKKRREKKKKKTEWIVLRTFSKSSPCSHVAFGERNEKRGMLLSEDTGVIKLFTVSKNVETMRRAASSGTLWAANCLQLCCRRTDRLLGFGRAALRPALHSHPVSCSPSCQGVWRTRQRAQGGAQCFQVLRSSAPLIILITFHHSCNCVVTQKLNLNSVTDRSYGDIL